MDYVEAFAAMKIEEIILSSSFELQNREDDYEKH